MEARANLRGMSMSEWIRRKCSQPESEQSNGSADHKDVTADS